MSIRVRMRQALPEAMRARDRVAVSALRVTLAALDNAEAVPVDEADMRGGAMGGSGAGDVPRRALTEPELAGVVRAEIAERLDAVAGLTAHAERVERLRAEAAVLQCLLDDRSL